MRGRDAGHRCVLSCPPCASTGADGSLCPCLLLSDLDGDTPVGAAELEAIEAYLMPQILQLLEKVVPPLDSEAPHIAATNRSVRPAEGKCREGFVKDPA
ncbi:hypothetical protein JOH52_000842 [Sinorhizobium meliloti]|nr:hypothetical protein [Sinorhizobium meliloti]GEC36454.1 hypothetical protein EME01_05260 [Sinorhizobium meliloti]